LRSDQNDTRKDVPAFAGPVAPAGFRAAAAAEMFCCAPCDSLICAGQCRTTIVSCWLN